jgi:AraC-like DNA-binding protein
MEINFDFGNLVHLVAAVFGILSGLLLLYFGIKSNPRNLPLAIGQIFASISIFVNFSLLSKLIFYWPFMYRMGHVFILLFLPMPYLNMVFHTKQRLWKWHDLLHAIPIMIFLVDYGHVLLMSNAEKLQILKEEVLNLNVLGQFRQSRYIGPGIHENARSFLFSGYWAAQVFLFLKWMKGPDASSPRNKEWKSWTIAFLLFQFSMFVPFFLSFLGMDKLKSYHATNSFVVIWLLLSSVSLFFFPSILYGKSYERGNRKTNDVKKTDVTEKEDKKLRETMEAIEFNMETRLLYLAQGYSINDFSKDIQVPAYLISKCLHTFQGVGFLDFINRKRTQYCIARFNNAEWLTYSIESIASECGFRNRNTFARAFKKFHGCFPSEYLRAKSK